MLIKKIVRDPSLPELPLSLPTNKVSEELSQLKEVVNEQLVELATLLKSFDLMRSDDILEYARERTVNITTTTPNRGDNEIMIHIKRADGSVSPEFKYWCYIPFDHSVGTLRNTAKMSYIHKLESRDSISIIKEENGERKINLSSNKQLMFSVNKQNKVSCSQFKNSDKSSFLIIILALMIEEKLIGRTDFNSAEKFFQLLEEYKFTTIPQVVRELSRIKGYAEFLGFETNPDKDIYLTSYGSLLSSTSSNSGLVEHLDKLNYRPIRNYISDILSPTRVLGERTTNGKLITIVDGDTKTIPILVDSISDSYFGLGSAIRGKKFGAGTPTETFKDYPTGKVKMPKDIFDYEYIPEGVEVIVDSIERGTIISKPIFNLLVSKGVTNPKVVSDGMSLVSPVKYPMYIDYPIVYPKERGNKMTLGDLQVLLSLITLWVYKPKKFALPHRDKNWVKQIRSYPKMICKDAYLNWSRLLGEPGKKSNKVAQDFIHNFRANITYKTAEEYANGKEKTIGSNDSKIINQYLLHRKKTLVDNFSYLQEANPVGIKSSYNEVTTGRTAQESNKYEALITASMAGVYCAFETPQGNKLGITNHITVTARIDNEGDMTIPLLKVANGVIAAVSEYYKVSDLINKKVTTLLDYNNNEIFKTAIQYSNINTDYCRVKKKEIDYVFPYDSSLCSLSTSLIPFIGNIDAARAVFGAAMLKQSVPIVRNEVPNVFTETYEVLGKDENLRITAPATGKVGKAISGNQFINEHYYVLENEDALSKVEAESKESDANTHGNRFRRIKETGAKVQEGDIIAESTFVKDGIYAPGTNLLTAYMSYDGYNYDDSALVSQEAANKLATFKVTNIVMKDEASQSGSKIEVRGLDSNIGKFAPMGTEISYKVSDSEQTREKRKRLAKYQEGTIITSKKDTKVSKNNFYMKSISYRTANLTPLTTGDKVAGRYGNKGTISKVEDMQNMPYLKNGLALEICISQLSLPSRMNPGQILESKLSLVAHLLNIKIKTGCFNTPTLEYIMELVKYVHQYIETGDIIYHGTHKIPRWFKSRMIEQKERLSEWKGCLTPKGDAYVVNPKTGKLFENPITIGFNYHLRLHHLAEEKVNSRNTGNYVFKTQAPPKGKSSGGGQSVGEMELAALIGAGASKNIQETLNVKSSNYRQRNNPLGLPEESYASKNVKFFLQALGIPTQSDEELELLMNAYFEKTGPQADSSIEDFDFDFLEW